MKSLLIIQLSLLFAVLVHGAAVKDSNSKNITGQIIGGNIAIRGTYKWAVNIKIWTGAAYTKQCGGSLISQVWVLTAAHCTAPFTKWELAFGAADMSVNEVGRVVLTSTYKVVHPQYAASTQVNDVSLIQTPSRVPINGYIDIIRMPRKSQFALLFDGQSTTQVGWGSTTTIGGPASPKLKVMTTHKVIKNSVCSSTYGSSTIVASAMCTSGPSGDNVCSMDSGGPVTWVDSAFDYKHTLIGVIAFTYGSSSGTCNSLKPAGHMRVTSYVPWISQVTGIPIVP